MPSEHNKRHFESANLDEVFKRKRAEVDAQLAARERALREEEAKLKSEQAGKRFSDFLTDSNIPPKPFDMSLAADTLNARLAEMEARLESLPYRLDAFVPDRENPNIILRFRRTEGKWRLELGELNYVLPNGPGGGPNANRVPDAELKFRPLRDVSLMKKAIAINLLPDLIEAMKHEYEERATVFHKASKTLDDVFVQLYKEKAVRKEGA